jgi:uncharacterized protein (TIGR02001 family)
MMKYGLILFCLCVVISPAVLAGPTQEDATENYPDTAIHAAANKPAETNVSPEKIFSWKNLSGSASVTNNYINRGISQSRNNPAVQATLTYDTPLHAYLYFFGSNVSFVGTNASTEMDSTLGYANTYGDHFAYDLSLSRYNYPGANNLAYIETIALANLYFLQGSISYSENAFASHKTGIYYNGGVNYDIPSKWIFGIKDLNFQALIGHYSLSQTAGASYDDYNIQLTKNFNKTYKFSLQWTSTNGGQHYSPYDDSMITGQFIVVF